ncbi:16S rRNA (cytosine(1402)-N(4))-methyltransferase RsmH [soil metagenome]
MSDHDAENAHQSVLLDESLRFLQPKVDGLYIDATLGLGGHSEALLEMADGVKVIGIDQDLEALEIAQTRLSKFGSRVSFFQANFAEIGEIVEKAGLGRPDGILADLGVSSLQLDSESRGFSFRFDSPLDMRMNADSDEPTVAELLATIGQEELANIIYQYGEERASRKIARWIIENRERGEPVRTTFELADLVRRAVPKSGKDKIHPATRTFQALRIAVNNELAIIEKFIFDSIDLLNLDGVLAIITFHSLEDRIVKHAFQRLAGKCQCPPRIPQCVCGAAKRVEILTRKPVLPTDTERDENPRSRSAKLRACRKLEQ